MASRPVDLPSSDIVRTLQQRVRQIESGHQTPIDATAKSAVWHQDPTAVGRMDAVVSSGCAALDRLLPAGGFRRGTLVEWLSTSSGSGAGTLAILVAREAASEGGAVVIVDRPHQFYPPAAAALGIRLEQTIVVRPDTKRDEIWALDQSLRCPGVAAVWSPLSDRLDQRDFRRLQLAAETGNCLGLLLRSSAVRGPSMCSRYRRCDRQFCDVRIESVPDDAFAGTASADARKRRLRELLTRWA